MLKDSRAVYTPGISERASGTSKFYHTDALGSTRGITNGSQAVTDAIKYLIDNHFYTKLLNTWGVADGAIASSAVTVNNNNSVGASCVPSY